MMNRVHAAVCGGLLLGAAASGAAHAEAAQSSATAEAPASTDAGGATSVPQLQEVVVTAEKRTESLQRAPVAIDVVSTGDLSRSNITNLEEMSRLVPSVQNGTAGGPFALFFIRGVGSFAANSLTDAAVDVSLAGVPLARQYGANGQMYDLQRIEVLAGPQGTLYGRNATGGVINILPNQPTFDREMDTAITVGNYDHIQTDGVLNDAIGQTSAARLSFQTIRHEGYLSDGEAEEDSQATRLQYRLEPGAGVSLLLSGDYFHQGGTGGGNALLNGGYTAGDRVGLAAPLAQAYYASIGRVPVTPQQLYIDGNYGGGKAELTWRSAAGTLVVIPAYRSNDVSSAAISGPLLLDTEHDHQKSLEARYLLQAIDNLQLIAGGYYLDDTVRARFNVDNLALNSALPSSGNIQDFLQDTKSTAGFADATLSVTHGLRLIGGVRSTRDEKALDGTLTTYASYVPPLPIDASRTWDSTDWRAGVQYDPSRDSMLYATVATGFHAGGFFFTHDNPTYQPERLKAYTIGSKNRLFDDTLHADVELFYWDYRNQQLSGVSSDSTGSTIFATVNAGRSLIKGTEVSLKYLARRNTLIGLQVQYLDARFEQFSLIQPFPGSPLSACRSAFLSAGHFDVDCSGLRPPQSPEWTANLDLQQTFALASGGSLTGELRGHYQTGSYMAVSYLPTDVQNAYVSGDVSVTYTSPGEAWNVGFYVDNFTNEAIKDSTNDSNVDSAALRAPRLYGLRVAVHLH